MYNITKTTFSLLVSGVLLWGCGNEPHSGKEAVSTGGAIGLPQDVKASCVVTADSFNAWFASGNATANGLVTPANSVAFPHQDNCDFYQWANRMFLWITSPSSGIYGQANTILESPTFFSVSPPDSTGHRVLIPHAANTLLRMSGGLQKNGPNRLPVIRSRNGGLYEIENARSLPGKMLVKGAANNPVEVDHVERDASGKVVFLDKAGKPIEHPRAIIQHKAKRDHIVHRFAVGKGFVFLDQEGNIIESEEGQATGDALMAKNGSLVYYLSFVNDVYAYYLTGVSNGQLNGARFPTTAGARDSICAFARANNVTLPDSNALAMELKTSWVEAAGLSDADQYITVMATIPVYDTSSPGQWIPTGERTAKMALVGVHIVGSVAGHPEMVWATFEHKNNTPNAAYSYVDSTGNTKTVAQDQGTHWLFNTNAADTPYNVSHMSASGDTIRANAGFGISPSNTLRAMPWGSAMDSLTNQQDLSSAASNSEILSINNVMQRLLVGNDIRKNYLFIGATWTFGGAAPNGGTYGADTTVGVSIGTNVLANSTMETYLQTTSSSCFSCHSGFNGPSLLPGDLSHIFNHLKPLINAYDSRRKAPAKK
ncbi:hypothetical protein [Taibaiella koreensis]|uniref:hypothetical protein n=1 Tax=Taibaiella koreensis TaxID=1268548 RepID=UPI000E59C7CA|nr:hypothetical protein [Taibaiella koreensis]